MSFRIGSQKGQPGQPDAAIMRVQCDNGRCLEQQFGQMAPGVPKNNVVQGFFNHLVSLGWLIQPEGHYCTAHKHAFMEPIQRSLIVPAVSMPMGMRN